MPPIWKGAVTFGLVHVPVHLQSAVRAEEEISFRLLDAEHLAPIKYERISSATKEPVAWKDIVKGYEVRKGEYVVLTEEEIKAAAAERSRTLEILDFVREEEIDLRYFEKPYYIVPQKGGEKAYGLLREAMRRSGVVGIGVFAMRQKEQLASLKPVGDALVLELLRWPNELVDPSEMSFPGAQEFRPQELRMAEQLVQNLSEPFDPTKYENRYRERLMEIIRAKADGQQVRIAEPEEPEGTKVVDLMARLEESLARSKGARGGARKSRGKAAAAPLDEAPKRRRPARGRRSA